MAIWGIGIMVAPVLGPTLGGYITDILNWRWVFYINLPVCLAALFLTIDVIRDTPAQKEKIDWAGLFLLATGIGALQIFLDRGNTSDWFGSKLIVFLCVIWIICLIAFVVRNFHHEHNIINLRLFKNREFASATLMVLLFGIAIFGVVTIQPIMLEHLMGYTARLTGLLMAPRGIAAAIGMLIASILTKRYDLRYIMFIGILINAYATYQMSLFNLSTSFEAMLLPTAIQGFGSGLFFVPLAASALVTLSASLTAEASGFFNFGRSLGGSIGISLLSTLITRESQINWNRLSSFIQPANPYYQKWSHTTGVALSHPLVVPQILTTIEKQSSMIAFADAYWALTICFLALIPVLFIMRKTKLDGKPIAIH